MLPVGDAGAAAYASDEYEFYVQDSWKVGSSLTVTAGLRYSLFSPPWEVNGLQVAPNVDLGTLFAQRSANMLAGIARQHAAARCTSIWRARRTASPATTSGTRTTSRRVSRWRGRRTPTAASAAG